MAAAVFALEIIAVFVLSVFLVHKYGNWKKQHWATSLCVVATWFLSFAVVFALPSDISTTLYYRCKDLIKHSNNTNITKTTCHQPWSFVTEATLGDFWNVAYWSLQLLSWLILPFLQSYVCAPQFTIRGKLLQMLKENAIFYGSFAVIFGVLFIYVVARGLLDRAGLHILITTSANTWGLFILVLLLGYGLIDVPRSFWHLGRLDYRLQKAYFQVAKLRTEMEESKDALDEVFKDVKTVTEKVRYNNPLRKHVNTILAKCPEDLARLGNRGVDDFEDYSSDSESDMCTMSGLVSLHSRVIKVSRNARRSEFQYKELLIEALGLEDLEENKESFSRRFHSSLPVSSRLHKFSPQLEWWWKLRIKPVLWLLVALLFTISSIVILWSEATFFSTSPTLSLLALLFQEGSSDTKYESNKARDNYVFIEIFAVYCISYLAACAYYPIYKLRVFNFYYLAPNHQTDQGSLLFNAMFLSRVVAPLCLNFLGMIHLDTHVTGRLTDRETSFTDTMGHLDVIPFIAKGFNIYFPMLLIILSAATLFRFGSRLQTCFGFQTFLLDDEMTTELIKQGKTYTRLERRSRERGLRDADSEPVWKQSRELASLRKADPIRSDEDEEHGVRRFSPVASSTSGFENDKEHGRFKMKYSRLPGSDDKVRLVSAMEKDPDSSHSSKHLAASYRRDASPKPSRPILSHSPRPASRAPPRNLFDDI